MAADHLGVPPRRASSTSPSTCSPCGGSARSSSSCSATRRYLALYFAAGLAGSAGALLATPLQPTVGASGAIYGILGSLLILEWLQTGTFMGPALTLIVINLAFSFTASGISWGGHIGGLVAGIVGTLAFWQARKLRQPWLGYATLVAIGALSVGDRLLESARDGLSYCAIAALGASCPAAACWTSSTVVISVQTRKTTVAIHQYVPCGE